MQFTILYLTAQAILGTSACPGTDGALSDLQTKLAVRQEDSSNDSLEMIGDLATTGATTPIGHTIQNILLGKVSPQSDEIYSGVLYPKGTSRCSADTCCIWRWIALDMQAKFRGTSGRCNAFARTAVRLGFHDAATWSKSTGFGGADGSLILANEGGRPENNGLQDISKVMQGWYDTYHKYGVGMADLIQMGANVATVVCPLGPRVRSFVGRKDSSVPNADGLLPNVFSDADTLLALFADKTIKAHGLAALVGAHTTSQQRFVDPSRALDPQDSTPGVWDVKFYGQTIGTEKTAKRVFKFPSDVKLAAHPKVHAEWVKFAGPGGQDDWNEDYSKEYVRLSLLGVDNINSLTECTKVLPPAIKGFESQDQSILNQWLAGGLQKVSELVVEATAITNAMLASRGRVVGNLWKA